MTRAPAAFSVALLSVLLGSSLFLPAQDDQDKIAKIFDRIEDSRGSDLWDGIRDLERLGRGSLDDIRKGLTRSDGFVRVAVAKVLYGRELRDEALDALSKVITGRNAKAKRAAADVAAALVGADSGLTAEERSRIARDFERQARAAEDPLAQIALWRAVWKLTGSFRPVREVGRLHKYADKRPVKEEAALTLAEMDRFADAESTLKELAKEPSDRGRMARAYLKVNRLVKDIDRARTRDAAKEPKYDFSLLEETIDSLKAWYYDEAKIDPEKLIEAATRGASSSLDRYTIYMDEKAINQLKTEDLEGKYGGIGARVSMRKDRNGNTWLTIEEPIFSGPAYDAGLRTHDRIVEVEGESTADKELFQLVRKLRGLQGTLVKFKVVRRGWTVPKEFTITREQISLETTSHRMLPGGLGYIKLVTFGPHDPDLVAAAIKDMTEKGMKALVFDLRGNSGGYLRTAHKIAGYFLEHGQIIVTTRGRGVEQDRRKAEGPKLTDVPVVMLVDQGSASASEILAGALQDHKRARLVGEKSFGKGSVQDLKFLKATDKKSAIKITISKWYLPSGRSVEKDDDHEGGVKPDVEAKRPELDFWRVAEFERLRAGDTVHAYVEDNWDKAVFEKLAESDGGLHQNYPKFDPFYEKLDTKASKDDVRRLVRELVRKRVQDDRGKSLYFDFQTDTVLQSGILEACKLAKLDAKAIKEYGSFAKVEKGKAAEK